jgi:dUTP pyrophosphatase
VIVFLFKIIKKYQYLKKFTMFKVQRVHPDAIIPTCGSAGSAGYDLYSVDDVVHFPRGSRILVNTGIKFETPEGTYGRIAPRSGLSMRGIDIGAGVIDHDYRGLVKVLLINNSHEPFSIEKGSRIAQLILERYVHAEIVECVLDDTERGSGGFGSTGV